MLKRDYRALQGRIMGFEGKSLHNRIEDKTCLNILKGRDKQIR